MNITTTFNKAAIAPFFNPFFKPEERAKIEKIISKFPLFVMESGGDIPADVIKSLMNADLTELMPYDGVRLHDRMTDGKRVNEWLLVIEKNKSDLQASAVCFSVTDIATGVKKIAPGNNGISIIVRGKLAAWRAFYSNGSVVKKSDFTDPNALELYDNASRHVLFSFLANFLNPHLHVASVRPNKQGKSVEWTQQRTHFVFIHKSHKANQKTFTGKADLESDHIERMAHSRRAHIRVLRHPRYKHKFGQTIRVKSCWVGPKEWEGNSGQVYRIVD